MGRKSSIAQLDPAVREAVDGAIRSGRATISQITLLINNLGADSSRSSVGRYVKKAEEQMLHYREAQEVAKVWIGRLESDPEGDVGRLLPEMLRTTAFMALSSMGESEEPVDVRALASLSRAVKDMAGVTKVNMEVARLKREWREALDKVAAVVEQAERDPEALKQAIAAAYGLI